MKTWFRMLPDFASLGHERFDEVHCINKDPSAISQRSEDSTLRNNYQLLQLPRIQLLTATMEQRKSLRHPGHPEVGHVLLFRWQPRSANVAKVRGLLHCTCKSCGLAVCLSGCYVSLRVVPSLLQTLTVSSLCQCAALRLLVSALVTPLTVFQSGRWGAHGACNLTVEISCSKCCGCLHLEFIFLIFGSRMLRWCHGDRSSTYLGNTPVHFVRPTVCFEWFEVSYGVFGRVWCSTMYALSMFSVVSLGFQPHSCVATFFLFGEWSEFVSSLIAWQLIDVHQYPSIHSIPFCCPFSNVLSYRIWPVVLTADRHFLFLSLTTSLPGFSVDHIPFPIQGCQWYKGYVFNGVAVVLTLLRNRCYSP